MSQPPYLFVVREALSDISPFKLLGEEASAFQIELDYLVAAGASLVQVDTFLTPPPLPNTGIWPAGAWSVGLTISEDTAPQLSYTVALWRADANGNDLEIIGVQPATQSGPGQQLTYAISGAALDPSVNSALSVSDRLKLKLFASNSDNANAYTLGIQASASAVVTPIIPNVQVSNEHNPYRRGRFLGYLFRPGEGANYFDEHGVNLDPNGQF